MSHTNYLDYISQFFSSKADFEAFTQAIHHPLPKTITLVQSRNNPQDTIQKINEEGFESIVSDYNNNNFIVDKGPFALGKLKEHLLGYFYIQETAASLPASILPIPLEGNILDMCAAPGGKTIQIADRCKQLGSTALVRANDPDSKRLHVLESNVMRCGMENVVIMNEDGTKIGDKLPEHFDVILLDAPCGGEGTGFKSDFGTKYRDIHKIQEIAHLQRKLLESAYKACKVGGTILYSTCTINPVENEENVQWFLDQHPGELELINIDIIGLSDGLGLDKVLRCWPHIQKTGGFFLSMIHKKGEKAKTLKSEHTQNRPPVTVGNLRGNKGDKKGFGVPNKGLGVISSKFTLANQKEVFNWLQSNFKIEVPEDTAFLMYKDIIYASKKSLLPYLNTVWLFQPGLPIIKGAKLKDRRPLHSSGVIFNFGKQFQLELDVNQIIKHISQEDFEVSSDISGFVQLMYDGKGVGIAKVIDGVAKNKFVGVV